MSDLTPADWLLIAILGADLVALMWFGRRMMRTVVGA